MAQIIKNLTVISLALCAGNVWATEEAPWPKNYKLAGEIIVSPARNSGKSSAASAADNREKARANQPDGAPVPNTTVIIAPNGEEGLLSPRGSESLPANRAKAKEYQSGAETQIRGQSQVLILPGRDPSKPETSRERVEDHRSKARSYMKGETPAGALGSDGLPVGGVTSTSSRDKARAYQSGGTPPAGATVIVVPNEEEGLLAPRGGESLPASRAKAREYQSGPDSHSQPQILIVPGRDPSKPETPRERVEDNRSKARSYMKGETPAGMVGADGLLVVNCRDVDSVAGRIGDDTQSGSIISIFQNGKQVKVRCK